MKIVICLGQVLGLASLCATATIATGQVAVHPISYTFSDPPQGQAPGVTYNYLDETHNPPSQPLGQLTDGIKGANAWYADLGNGPAYEWVSWLHTDPTITFTFAAPVTVSTVEIGFNRAGWAGIELPGTVTIGGTAITLTGNEIGDSVRGDLDFTGSWHGASLAIMLTHATPEKFLFVDEFTFTSNPVPESTHFAALIGVGLLGFAEVRRITKA